MSKTPVAKQQKGEITSLTIFHKPVGDVSDTKWRDLIEDQDYDAIIADIREDIIKQVMDECYRKHIKRNVYKFLIECAYEAFQQLVPLYFYKYDDSYKSTSGQESWIADEEPVVCKPDSWAKGNIPYNVDELPKNKYQQTDSVSSEYNLIKCREYPSSHVFDTESKVIVPEEENDERSYSYENVLVTYEPAPMSRTSVQFIKYNPSANMDMVPSIQDIVIQQPSRVVSENMFYKIMKVNRMSSLSIQNSGKGKKYVPPAWTTIDEIKEEIKTHGYGPSRYLQMRRECLAAVDRKPPSKN